jgi:hypothetical protein
MNMKVGGETIAIKADGDLMSEIKKGQRVTESADSG